MKQIVFFFLIILFFGCNKSTTKSASKIQLKFLDEYILPNNLMVDSTLVGGLSGIDFYNNEYYIACDDSKNPRYYKAYIDIKEYAFDTIQIEGVVELGFSDKYLDLESILVSDGKILLTSEGNIRKGKDPSFFSVNLDGNNFDEFKIPEYYKAKSEKKPRHNGVFEGLTKSFNGKGYWIVTELPLKADGPKPKLKATTSPIRFTYFDINRKATKQFAYLLDMIAKKPLGDFAVNGVTDMLTYANNKMLVIERSFSSGHGTQGTAIKLYSIDYSKAVNTISIKKLEQANYHPVKKELVFNFETIRGKLTDNIIDNIEGLCFGPKLPNGNKSLILVVDNDFNKQGNRLNQFILMEIIN